MVMPLLMNFSRIKALTWLGTLSVGAYLAWSVTEFLQHKDELSAPVTRDDQLAVLSNVKVPEPPKTSLVNYDHVSKTFHDMNWTGKEAPKVAKAPTADPKVMPKTPVSDLLSVLLLQVDTSDEEGSLGFVKFLEPALAQAAKSPDDHVLRVGTTLTGRYDKIMVSAITVAGVEFSFTDDEGRAKEIVPPVAFPTNGPGIVQVGPGGVIEPEDPSRIFTVQDPRPFRPKDTYPLGKNSFQLGYQVVEDMNTDYSRILSQDLRYGPHRDSKTGKVDGLKITSVSEGSIPAQHGLKEGEILKSVNGHKVTSTSDLITFIKDEADRTDTWVAVFELRGREFTRTYKSPPPE